MVCGIITLTGFPISVNAQVDYKPLGIRVGSFILHPRIEWDGEYNENIFSTDRNEESDFIFHFKPYASLSSAWTRHEFNLSATADIAKYNDFSSEDYEDYMFQAAGRLDVRRGNFFTAKFDYMDLHEKRSSPDDQGGDEPTTYTLIGGNVGYQHTFNRMKLLAVFAQRGLDFDDVGDGMGGIINNQDRDRDEEDFSLRVAYEYRTSHEVFVQATRNSVDYDDQFDDRRFNRSSNGREFRAGLALYLTGIVVGDVYVGYLKQEYDDPLLLDVDGYRVGLGIKWTPSGLTTVTARMESGTEETTSQYASGYLKTLYSVRVDHELKRNILLNGQVSFSNNNYEQIAGAPAVARDNENVFSASIGISYLFNRNVSLSAGYRYEKKDSNVITDEYTTQRFFLILGLEM